MRTSFFWLVTLCVAAAANSAHGNLLTFQASADTSLNQHSPNNNMGAFNAILAGESGQPDARRGLIAFNLAPQLPAGSVVTSATLSLTVANTPTVASNFDLDRALVSWSEGSGTGNQGTAANAGESTWNARAFGSLSWGAAGGLAGADFAATPSAVSLISASAGAVSWSGAGLAADVQYWVDHPASNFGWFLVSENEATKFTACQVYSRESASGYPVLLVQTSPAPEPAMIALLLAALACAGAYFWRRRSAR